MKLNKLDKNKSGIYVIVNKINGKVYVGKSKNIYIRVKQHITLLNTRSKNENIRLINSWHKHGKSNFEYYVAEYFDFDEDLMKVKELFWMEKLDSLNKTKGYNLRKDASTSCEVKEETRERCRQAQLNRYKDPKERKKSSEASKKFWAENEDIKEKMKLNLSKSRRRYRVAKLDKVTEELIKIYDGIKDVQDENPDYYLQAVKGCCGGNKASYKGFKWKYMELNNDVFVIR